MTRSPIFYSAVFVVLENENGDYLLQKRQNTGYMDGYYDASMSGHVEMSESVYDAALRELTEEIGVTATKENLELVMLSQMDVDRPYLNYTFICKEWAGEPRVMESDKNSELIWRTASSMPDKMTPTMELLRVRSFAKDTSVVEYVDSNRFKELMNG